MVKNCIAGCISAALMVVAATASHAQTLRTIVPFGPGGAPDTVARVLAEYINKTHNLSIVVENRPGAGSIVATEAVMRLPPDGNTLLITASSFLANPHMRKVNYNALTDFTPVCLLVSSPALIAVDAKSPYKTLDDLIKAAKAAPGKLSLGTPGPGSSHHILFEGFKQRAGIDMTYVPYPGTGPAVAATMGGHVTAVLSDYGSLSSQLQSGDLRPLAVATASSQRAAVLPNVPTFTEAGFPGLGLESWFGIVAPAKMSEKVINERIEWYREALGNKAATAKLVAMNLNPNPVCGAEFGKFLQETSNTFADIISKANLKVK